MFALWWLLACSDAHTLAGEVVDIWGKPVAGATVVIEGVVDHYTSDGAGKFTIETEKKDIKRVAAVQSGYIKQVVEAGRTTEEDDWNPLSFRLYPAPAQPGFYGVGRTNYIHLQARRIHIIGTDLKHYAGLQDIPEETIPRGKPEFVFYSTLRSSELSQMNLHLSRLKFIDKAPLKGILGRGDATVNLWIADADVPYDLKALPARDNYVIQFRDDATPGIYAFHAQDVLNEEDSRVLMNLPKERQVAFPFEIK